MPLEKVSDDQITTTKIYEVLNSNKFQTSLWYDLISDIHEKPTFKYMMDLIERFINKQIDDLASAASEKHELFDRRPAFKLTSAMAFTIDTVISKVLYLKFQKEMPFIIRKMIKEVKEKNENSTNLGNEKKQTKTGIDGKSGEPRKRKGRPRKVISEGEFIEALESNKDKKSCNSSNEGKIDSDLEILIKQGFRERVREVLSSETKSPVISPSLASGIEESQYSVSPKKKVGRPRKNKNVSQSPQVQVPSISSKTEKTAVSSSPKGKEVSSPNKGEIRSTSLTPSKEVTKFNKSPAETVAKNIDSYVESDSESCLSFSSVSSVHTSELSSYDDEISLSDGEIGKKRIPVKKVKEMLMEKKSSVKGVNRENLRRKTSKKATKVNGATKPSVTHEEIKAEISKIVNAEVEKPKAVESVIPKVEKEKIKNETSKSPGTEKKKSKAVESVIPKIEKEKIMNETSKSPSTEKKKSKDSQSDEENFSNSMQVDSPPKVLPKRVRKPNSKYASYNVISPLSGTQQKRVNGSPEQESIQKRKKADETPVSVNNKLQNNSFEEKHVENNLKPSIPPSFLHSLSPRPVASSLTTRKSAPITLFSTGINIKS